MSGTGASFDLGTNPDRGRSEPEAVLRSFLRDSVAYGAATVVARGAALLAVPIVTRFLAPADYGSIDVIAVFTSFAGVIVSLEIVQAVARFYPDSEGPEARMRIASTSLLVAVAGYAALLVVGELFATDLAAALLGTPERVGVVRVALLAIFANGFFYVVQSQLRWRLMAARYAVSSGVYAATSVGVTVALVVAGAGPEGVFAGQIMGALIGTIMSWRSVGGDFGLHLHGPTLRAMLRFSVPLVPSSLSVYLTLYVDRIAINAFLGLSAVGLFGIGYRVASLVTLANFAVQGALGPLIYSHYSDSRAPADLARIFRSYVAVQLVIWLGLGLFTREVLAIAAAADYGAAAIVVPILTPALALSSLYAFAPGLSITKRTGQLAIVNLLGAALNTTLNYALVPPFGIAGAATATLLSAATVFGATMTLSQRAYPVPHAWSRLGGAFVVVGGLVALGWAAGAGLPASTFRVGLFLLGVGACIGFGLVTRGELRAAASLLASRLGRRSGASASR